MAAIGLPALAILAAVLLACPGRATAQPALPPAPVFLIINQEQLLTGSERGKALLAEESAARERLRGEARATDAAFEAEEQALTELRSTLDADAFRAKAEDFDARVVAARRDQDSRSAALVQEFDGKRRQFYASVAPILVQLMERYGALAIFDETSVLIADQSLLITAAVIEEIDGARPAVAGGPGAAPVTAPPASGQETLPGTPAGAPPGGGAVQLAPMPRPETPPAPDGALQPARE